MKPSILAGVASLALTQAMAPAHATETITYTYDELGRLVASSSSGSVNNGQNTSISYDAADNRSTYAVSGASTPSSPVLSIAAGSAVTEGGTLNFSVSLTPAATSTVTVDYATADGTAMQPADYYQKSGSLTFTTGQSSKTVTVTTLDDSTVESTETMAVTLSNPSSNATIGTASATGTINDNDSANATLSIGNASVTEGQTLGFTVTRTGDTSSAVSASYATASGTATSGSDFTAKSGTVSFASGAVSQTVTVNTTDDAAVESAETMTVTLSNPSSGATIGTATGTGTINDNDTAGATLSVGNVTVTEGDDAFFYITRSGNTSSSVSVNYATASGSATIGTDFGNISGTKSFASGETSKFVAINTDDDSLVEGTETFYFQLSNPSSGATLGTGTATGTINDNDVASGPVLTVDDVTVTEGDTAFFWVYRSGDTSSSVSFNYATVSGTAIVGTDVANIQGTKTLSAGQTQVLIAPSTTDDSLQEGTETFTVAITNITGGATINNANPVGTILDND